MRANSVTANRRARVTAALCAALVFPVAVRATDLPPAIRALADRAEAEAVAGQYTNDHLRCASAGFVTWLETDGTHRARRQLAELLPANMSFQLAVAGTDAEAQYAQRAVEATRAALAGDVRRDLAAAHWTAPILGWLVRRARCAFTNETRYLSAACHPPFFTTNDFDTAVLTAAAGRLRADTLPPVAIVAPVWNYPPRVPIVPAKPGLDYPDPAPEVTFATGFGVGIVLRAPETVRVFRFRAGTWPFAERRAEYAWRVLRGGVSVRDWRDGSGRASRGFAELSVDVRHVPTRADVAVFARMPGGLWGPPAMISFYRPPDEQRVYARDGSIEDIVCGADRTPFVRAYDLETDTSRKQDDALSLYGAAIFRNGCVRYGTFGLTTPKAWTDSFTLDAAGRIETVSRRRANAITPDRFSYGNGELIVATWPNGMPRTTIPVTYAVRDGLLDYSETKIEHAWPHRPPAARTRGEHTKYVRPDTRSTHRKPIDAH